MTKPDDILIDNATDYDPPRDINNAIEFAEQGWAFRSGTASERGSLASDEKFDRLVWMDRDAGRRIYQWNGSTWIAFAAAIATRKWSAQRGADGTFSSGSFVGVVNTTITDAPAGQYLVGLNGSYSGSTNSVGNIRFMVGVTNVSNDMRHDITTQAQPATFVLPYTHGGGDLALVQSFQMSSAGTATVYAGGTSIWAAYIGP